MSLISLRVRLLFFFWRRRHWKNQGFEFLILTAYAYDPYVRAHYYLPKLKQNNPMRPILFDVIEL